MGYIHKLYIETGKLSWAERPVLAIHVMLCYVMLVECFWILVPVA